MFADFQDLIELLNKYKAKYLVIGGYAVSRHAQPRYTKDLDLFILPAPDKRTRTQRDGDAITPARELTAEDFEKKDTWYTMGVPPYAIDVLPEIPGVTFEAAWNNRSTQVIDEATGLTAHFISRDDLIAAKLASGRDQDLLDVNALRSAAAAEVTAPPKPAATDPKAKRKKTEP